MSPPEEIYDLPPPPADARVPYGSGEHHFGDVRVPAGSGPFPVVMNIHGGFWRARYGLDHAGHLCAALAREGIATWNVEYRRLGHPGGGWTGTFEDVSSAADFLPALAGRFSLDTRRAVVMGHSAGGHLALWTGARPTFSAAHPLRAAEPFQFRGVVALAPVADLAMGSGLRLSSGVTDELMGGPPGEQPERYASASPAELLPLGLPQVLLHGTLDDTVPLEISERYARAALESGDDCTLERLPGAGHAELIDPRTREWGAVLSAVNRLLND